MCFISLGAAAGHEATDRERERDGERDEKRDADGAKDTVHGRNKPFFLRQSPNQSRLACIHGLIRENTRPLSSLSLIHI